MFVSPRVFHLRQLIFSDTLIPTPLMNVNKNLLRSAESDYINETPCTSTICPMPAIK